MRREPQGVGILGIDAHHGRTMDAPELTWVHLQFDIGCLLITVAIRLELRACGGERLARLICADHHAHRRRAAGCPRGPRRRHRAPLGAVQLEGDGVGA